MVRKRNKKDGDRSLAPDQSRQAREAYRFQTLGLQDLEEVVRIEKRCFPAPWSRESFREILEGAGFQVFGIKDGPQRLAAYIVVTEMSNELHILNLAVAPSLQRQGLASTLLRYVHEKARKRGRRISYLEVRQSNQVAQDLYLKFGYTPVGHRFDYYPGDREDAVVMASRLDRKSKER